MRACDVWTAALVTVQAAKRHCDEWGENKKCQLVAFSRFNPWIPLGNRDRAQNPCATGRRIFEKPVLLLFPLFLLFLQIVDLIAQAGSIFVALFGNSPFEIEIQPLQFIERSDVFRRVCH